MDHSQRIILSRALTNSGDQAWDFAVPVTLALLLPGQLGLVSFVFFSSRLCHVVLLPLIGSILDGSSRLRGLKIGLLTQAAGVALQTTGFFYLPHNQTLALVLLILGSLLSGLGSNMTSIAVAQDLVPSLFHAEALSKINSRIRQVDLISEVCSPMVAGALLLLASNEQPLLGLFFIAAWNLLSFVPEFFLLRGVLVLEAEKLTKVSARPMKRPLWESLSSGWHHLTKLAIAPAVFAYAFLWFSVLSPHGVLLTSFLKESWDLPELTLGVFRGLGAVFGLLATLAFPKMVSRWGLVGAASWSVALQGLMLTLSLVCFHLELELAFLAFVLFSRVGLYSFSLGEQQIRQLGIPENLRGVVNSAASALTSLANLGLLGLGIFLGSEKNFPYLIHISVVCILVGGVVFRCSLDKIKSGIRERALE